MPSTINERSTEFGERTLTIDHNFGENYSLVISERDDGGTPRVLLDITVGAGQQVNLKATIIDKALSPP